MKLFVALPAGRTISLSVDGLWCPVRTVQQLLHEREGIAPADQRLCFGGRELRTHTHNKRARRKALNLADHDVTPDATLHLLGRLPGAALLGKSMKGKAKGMDDDEAARRLRMEIENQKFLHARLELKQRMEQERTNSRVNRLKIQNKWRKNMRRIKVGNLKKQISILSQNHERDVDRKDAIIQMFDRDLEEAEDQFQMALRAHLENMDRLVDLQDTRLLGLEQEFEKELHALETEFHAEKQAIVTQHNAEVRELDDIMAAVHEEETEREAEAKQEHEQHREEIKNRNLEEINMLRIQLDSQIEDLEQKFENAHLNYLQTTDQRTSDFKFFTKKDQELSKDIEVKIRKIERLQSSLNTWRTKHSQNVKESAARNQLLTEEKNQIQSHFLQLKLKMNKFRERQARRLSELTQNTNRAQGALDDQIALAERILKLAELARKSETDREKVALHVGFMDVEADADAEAAAMAEADGAAADVGLMKPQAPPSAASGRPADGSGGGPAQPYQPEYFDHQQQPVEKWQHVNNFYLKYNKALLDKLAIERERDRLDAENASYQQLLKQYLDGVSVNDTVIQNDGNPLFVVNGRIKLNAPLPVRRGEKVVVVDGNHMVGTARVNTVAL